jgi:hypothetical protein
VASEPSEDRASNEVLRFGYSLMEEGDYYRAITEFKRYAFLRPGSDEQFPAYLAIGRAYELGGKAGDAVVWLRHLQPYATTPQLRADLVVELAFARYLSGAAPLAADDLQGFVQNMALFGAASHDTQQRALYLLGWSQLVSNRPHEAAEAWRQVELPYAHQMAEDALAHEHLPRKSPVLAAVLSALVPGLGHVYLGQPLIGLAAFGWNALFIAATADAFYHRLYGLGAVTGGLELLWYGGALFGAVSGAQKYNRDAELNHLDELKHRYDAAPAWPRASRAASVSGSASEASSSLRCP